MKSALMEGMRAAGLDDVELTRHAASRYRDLKSSMEGSKWWSKREKYERIAATDLSHRLSGDAANKSIFDRTNQSLQLVRSISKFLVARTWKDLFGSSPWFSAKPKPGSAGIPMEEGMEAQGGVTPALIEQIQPHVESKLTEAGYKSVAKGAIKTAFDLGECAVKTTWCKKEDVSERLALILCDGKEKVVIQDGPSKGEYIFDDDEATDVPTLGPDGAPVIDPATKRPATTRQFTKAPDLAWKPSFKFTPHLIEERKTLYNGVHVSTIYWKDLFWEINKSSLEESDVAHTFDITLSELRAVYNPDGDNEDVQAALDLLKTESHLPKSEGALPRESLGEPTVNRSDVLDPVIKVTELYLDVDVFGDGTKRRIFLVMAVERELTIWAEYRAAMSPLAAKCIHMIPVNKVEGRAYGRGNYEMYEMASDAMDKLLNSILWRNSYNSDPVKFWNPGKTVEGDTNPNLVFEPGKTYTAKGQANANEILQIIELPDLDERTWQLMQLFMQLAQVESGVTNSAQSAVSQLEENKTATATNALTEVSSVLHLYAVEELKDGFQPQLKYTVELVYFRQDADESYADGKDTSTLALADASQLSGLPMHVEITLTRVKQQSMREAAVAAIPIVDQYYDKLAMVPGFQAQAMQWKIEKTQPLYLQVLKGLEVQDADDYFPSLEELAAVAQANAAAMQQQAQLPADVPAVEGEPALPDNVIPSPEPTLAA